MDNGQSEKHSVEQIGRRIEQILTELEVESIKLDNFDTMKSLYSELDMLSKQYARLTNHALVEKL